MLQFYSYILAIRDQSFSLIHCAGKLFHQYIVDCYTKIEANRLNYIREHQTELRVDLYKGLLDYVKDKMSTLFGKITILPSTFKGCTRNMTQSYQDAMSIVRKYGKPDLFVTFTCNPNWSEIMNSLLPNQLPHDRPDIIARVFKIKLKRLMEDIKLKHIFGVPVAHVHVVEFQVNKNNSFL